MATTKKSTNVVEIKEVEKTNGYTLRRLTADDIFPMCSIISKIGIGEFKKCFESVAVKSAISSMLSNGEESEKEKGIESIGMAVIFDIVGIVLGNLPKCRTEIYNFVSNISNKTVEEVAKLDMATFFHIIVDIIKKPEFKDFLGLFQNCSKRSKHVHGLAI